MLLWAASTVIVKSSEVTGTTFAVCRLWVGVAALWLVCRATGRRIPREVRRASIVPGALFAGNIALFFEAHAQIPTAVESHAGDGVRDMMTFGLAGDMLGYILAPFPESYPEPIRRSFFGGDPNDPTTWELSPIDNDNYFFNVSHTLGERVICSMLRGAGSVLQGDDTAFWAARPQCLLFVNDLLLPAGSDATLS